MDYQPVLENKRVLLEPLQLTHLEVLAPVALIPSLWEVQLQQITTVADLEKYIRTGLADREAGVSIPFVITDKKENKVAGSTRYMNLLIPHKRTEIGSTWIAPEFQGTGLNKAMKYAMLQYAFEVMDVNRVELKTDALNTQSRNAILSIGCKEEGIFRRHMITNSGRVRDTVYFSILKEEWPEVKERIFGKYDF
ncbi:GNAT family protein [Chitinophaga sp. 212800010-3]|uniref:GNAT family N-acetyltransferase n=1 Tax=unclassified Chitinophaga TaxID=2619133 RepID=UPI002DF22139|nr:Protein N-acetyltransferase, RimJ/RimL family [Chitinophaga sp. 212800010-3]